MSAATDFGATYIKPDSNLHLNSQQSLPARFNCSAFNAVWSDFSVVDDILVAAIVTCLFLVGVFLITFGYRLFQATLFVAGFLFGCFVVYFICQTANLPREAVFGISVASGAVVGLLCILIQYIAVFLIGCNAGFASAILVIFAHSQAAAIDSLWISIAYILGLCLLVALLNLKFQKVMTIFSTTIVGAALMTIFLDFLLERNLFVLFILNTIKANTSTEVVKLCWYSYLIASSFIIYFVAGIGIQTFCTARNYSHKTIEFYHTIRRVRNRGGGERGHRSSFGRREESGGKPKEKKTRQTVPSSATTYVTPPQMRHKIRSACVDGQRMPVTQSASAAAAPSSMYGGGDNSNSNNQQFKQLYHVRRCHGDVLSNDFMKDISAKLAPPHSHTSNEQHSAL